MVLVKQLPSQPQAITDPVAQATRSFLYGVPVESSLAIRPSTTAYLIPTALKAIADGNREAFAQAYAEIRRRKVQPDADWVFDNFLLFALTTGVLKFREDRAFLNEICRQRVAVQQGAELELVRGLEAVVRGETPPSQLGLALVVKAAAGTTEFDAAIVKGAYAQAKKLLATGSTDQFQLLMAQRAADLAFEHSVLASVSVSALVERFQKRASIVAAVLFWMLCLGCFSVFGWLLWYFFLGSGKAEAIADKLISLGVGGAPLVVFGAKKRIQTTIANRLQQFWLGMPVTATSKREVRNDRAAEDVI